MPSPSPAISGSALDVGASSSFTIEVLFFGSARDAVGNVSAITLGLPEGSDTATLRYSTVVVLLMMRWKRCAYSSCRDLYCWF